MVIKSQTGAASAAQCRSWSISQRIGFRFAFLYYLLYAAPAAGRTTPLGIVPGLGFITRPYIAMWHAVVTWIGAHFLRLNPASLTHFTGGDLLPDVLYNGCLILVAAGGSVMWSIADRKRAEYRELHAWLRLLVRYTLAFVLFSYGFAKVIPIQFQTPAFFNLMKPYGQFTPSAALWHFMGTSLPYTILSGAAEVISGLLLLFERTTTVGAMLSAVVMANVVALNYFYDVGVKFYSTNLLLMAIFLLIPELSRLSHVLVCRYAAAPRLARKWQRIAGTALLILVTACAVYDAVAPSWRNYQRFYVHPARPPLYGLYRIESGGPRDWQDLAMDYRLNTTMFVRMADDSTHSYVADYDTAHSTVQWFDTSPATTGAQGKRAQIATLVWSRPDPDHLLLSGTFEGAQAAIRLRRVDQTLPLLTHRFHWVSVQR